MGRLTYGHWIVLNAVRFGLGLDKLVDKLSSVYFCLD